MTKAQRLALIKKRVTAMKVSRAQKARWADRRRVLGLDTDDDHVIHYESVGNPDHDIQQLPDSVIGD